jgi:hypothetical protein
MAVECGLAPIERRERKGMTAANREHLLFVWDAEKSRGLVVARARNKASPSAPPNANHMERVGHGACSNW